MEECSSHRQINAESTGIERKGRQMLDSISTGWTDEKHMLYLSSMEASFVDQLYSNEDHFIDLLGCSPRSQNGAAASSTGNHLLPGKFKVLRRGGWGNLEFCRAKARVGNGNESSLSANPWVQHFRSRSNGKDGAIKTGHKVGNDKLASGLVQEQSKLLHGRVTAFSTKILACPQASHQNLTDPTTEVSDQNFADEVKEEAESSRVLKKKRSIPSPNMVADQVVPCGKSLVEQSYENEDCIEPAVAHKWLLFDWRSKRTKPTSRPTVAKQANARAHE